MNLSPSAPLSRLAVVSLILGLLSLPLLAAAGIPALILGVCGLREVNRSDSRLRGRRLALTGLALGALGTLATAVLFGWIIVVRVNNASRRAQCAFNLKQDADAVFSFYDHSGTRPEGRHFPPGTIANKELKSDQRLSWMVSLLPFLARPEGDTEGPWQALVKKIDHNKGWDAPDNAAARTTNVPLFLCPAQRVFDPRTEPGRTTYVGVAGIDPDAARLPKEAPRAGFFGYDRHINLSEVTAGTSYTMMVVETGLDNGLWCAGGPPTVRGLSPDDQAPIGLGRPFGGFHPGGLNVLWADRSVHWVAENVDPALFRSWAVLSREYGKKEK